MPPFLFRISGIFTGMKSILLSLFFLAIICTDINAQQALDPVSQYYEQLKQSKQKGGPETAFMS